MQLNYWPCVTVTIQIQAACYEVVGSSPGAANFFFIKMFNLGIANGAKVGLKLRLIHIRFELQVIMYTMNTIVQWSNSLTALDLYCESEG